MSTNRKIEVTGLKITGLSVPLFPDKESELRSYGDELALYLNNEKRSTKWLPYSKGAADMLRRWASKLPEPPLKMLREIAGHTQAIQLQRASVEAPIRGRRIEPILLVELDIPTAVAGVAYMLATILSARYGQHLRQCELDGCEFWFFDIPEGRRSKEYCRASHSNAHRQREWRERQKTKNRRHRK